MDDVGPIMRDWTYIAKDVLCLIGELQLPCDDWYKSGCTHEQCACAQRILLDLNPSQGYYNVYERRVTQQRLRELEANESISPEEE